MRGNNASFESNFGGIREALENAPPELSADLIDMGLVLTQAEEALLKNIDKLISQDTGLPFVPIADDPLSCAAIGTSRSTRARRIVFYNVV